MRTHPEKHDPSPYESRIFQLMSWLPERRDRDERVGFALLKLSRANVIYETLDLLATLEANGLIRFEDDRSDRRRRGEGERELEFQEKRK